MSSHTLKVNGREQIVNVSADTPLLWVLRDTLGLVGSKYSCGAGLCGACTVHVDGEATHACVTPVSSVAGKAIVTIEGLSAQGPHPLQQAWLSENVPQCGYCQPGQIMRAAVLLARRPNPSDEEIDEAMAGNLCRCGTYLRIRRAIHAAAGLNNKSSTGYREHPGIVVSSAAAQKGAAGMLALTAALALGKAGTSANISRRNFLKVSTLAGAGLVLGICLPGCQTPPPATPESRLATAAPTVVETATTRSVAESTPLPTLEILPAENAGPTAATALATEPISPSSTATVEAAPTEPAATPEPTSRFSPNVFLSIDNHGMVTVTVHRSEMGQGVRTALAMILAEELEANWADIRVQQAPADPSYGSQDTHGSLSMIECYKPLRQAGAMARTMLVAAAAEIWGVDGESCYAANGTVVHQESGKQLGYGDLVDTAAALPLPATKDVILKDAKDFRIIGTSLAGIDNAQLVDGSGIYGIDIRLPDMLYAAVARCPVFGGSVASLDSSLAEAVEGVRQVFTIDGGVAVVADSTWSALKGRESLIISWDEGVNSSLNSSTARQWFAEQTASTQNDGGDQMIEAVYGMPFLAHTTMSPMNCVAHVGDDFCEVWAPTQRPMVAKSRAQAITKLPANAITVHVSLLGGGFGRRREDDYVADAVQISQVIRAPIKLTWTREDDIQHDFYHPLSYQQVSTGADTPGRYQVQASQTLPGVPTGAWRSAVNLTPAFVRECLTDELAVATGADPYEMRLGASTYKNLKAVLEMAAMKADWGAPLTPGRGRGIAAYSSWDTSHVAEVVEVTVRQDGGIQVDKVVCAIDCGLVINPDIVKAQIEGGIAYGLTAALKGEITIKDGRVEQSNFHDYAMLRMDEMPNIEVYILPSERSPQGAGEISVPPIIPALLNAIFDATGKRIRLLPVRPETLLET